MKAHWRTLGVFTVRNIASLAFAAVSTANADDGLDIWHWRNAGPNLYLSAITHSAETGFVIVDQNGPLVQSVNSSALLFSPLGTTWQRRETGTNDLMTDRIAHGNGEYRAVRYSQYAFPAGEILRSTNGVDWSVLNLDFLEESLVVKATKFVNGRWIALGVPRTSVGFFPVECGEPFGPPCPPPHLRLFGAGSSWMDLEIPASWLGSEELNLAAADFAFGGGKYVVMAWVYSGDYFEPFARHRAALFAWSSPDGTNYVRSAPLVQSQISSVLNTFEQFPCNITHGNGRFVASVGLGHVFTSHDGYSWTTNATAGATTRDVAFGGGQFVAVGAKGGFTAGAIVTSTDGVNWNHRDPGAAELLKQVEYGNHRFVAIGGTNVVLQSGPIVTLDLTASREFKLSAPAQSEWRIEFTTDLNSTAPWEIWTTIQVSADPMTMLVPEFTGPRRFFRATLQESAE